MFPLRHSMVEGDFKEPVIEPGAYTSRANLVRTTEETRHERSFSWFSATAHYGENEAAHEDGDPCISSGFLSPAVWERKAPTGTWDYQSLHAKTPFRLYGRDALLYIFDVPPPSSDAPDCNIGPLRASRVHCIGKRPTQRKGLIKRKEGRQSNGSPPTPPSTPPTQGSLHSEPQ